MRIASFLGRIAWQLVPPRVVYISMLQLLLLHILGFAKDWRRRQQYRGYRRAFPWALQNTCFAPCCSSYSFFTNALIQDNSLFKVAPWLSFLLGPFPNFLGLFVSSSKVLFRVCSFLTLWTPPKRFFLNKRGRFGALSKHSTATFRLQKPREWKKQNRNNPKHRSPDPQSDEHTILYKK